MSKATDFIAKFSAAKDASEDTKPLIDALRSDPAVEAEEDGTTIFFFGDDSAVEYDPDDDSVIEAEKNEDDDSDV